MMYTSKSTSIHWKQTSMTTRHASSYSNDKNRKQNWIKSFFASFELRNLTNPNSQPFAKICNVTFPWVTSTGSFSTSMEKLCTETGQVAEKSKVCRESDAASAVDVESGRCCACSWHTSKGDRLQFSGFFFESKKVTKWYLFTKWWKSSFFNNIDITQHITLKLPLKITKNIHLLPPKKWKKNREISCPKICRSCTSNPSPSSRSASSSTKTRRELKVNTGGSSCFQGCQMDGSWGAIKQPLQGVKHHPFWRVLWCLEKTLKNCGKRLFLETYSVENRGDPWILWINSS